MNLKKSIVVSPRAVLLSTILFLWAAPKAEGLSAGDRGVIYVPFSNLGVTNTTLQNVRMTVLNAPQWMEVLDVSALSVAAIAPQSTFQFHLDYEVGASFAAATGNVEMDLSIAMDTQGVFPFASNCHLSSPDGLQTVSISCTDNLGNLMSQVSFPDKTPPITSLDFGQSPFVGPNGVLYISTSATISLEAADPVVSSAITSGVQLTMLGIDALSSGALPIYQGNPVSLAEGMHTLFYNSVDKAGNMEVVRSSVVAVDGTPPATVLQLNGATVAVAAVSADSSTRISFIGFDPISNGVASGISRILYRIDASTSYSMYSAPFSLGVGFHQLQYFGIDYAENVETPNNASLFVGVPIDTQPPTTQLVLLGSSTPINGPLISGSSITVVST